jgi:membrane-bound lytic murein transglycosylase A
MLVPKSLDPAARGRKMPLPDPRPSEKIAKLFPPTDPLKDQPKDQKGGDKPAEVSAAPGKNLGAATAKNAAPPPASVAQASPTQAPAATTVPLPEARPSLAPSRELNRRGRHHYYHGR